MDLGDNVDFSKEVSKKEFSFFFENEDPELSVGHQVSSTKNKRNMEGTVKKLSGRYVRKSILTDYLIAISWRHIRLLYEFYLPNYR